MRMEWEQLKRQVFGQKKIYLLGLRLLFYLGGNFGKGHHHKLSLRVY